MGATIVNKFYLPVLIALLVGCQQPANPNAISPVSKCSETLIPTLKEKNVKTISLDTQEIKESGTAYLDTSIAFSFDAQSGQDFTYRTDDDICIWIYTPDSQILTGSKLPRNGKYIVQVSAPRGQTTFKLSMKLTTSLQQRSKKITDYAKEQLDKKIAAPTPVNPPPIIVTPPISDAPPPIQESPAYQPPVYQEPPPPSDSSPYQEPPPAFTPSRPPPPPGRDAN
jgi:hypothetical protein